MGMEGNGCGFEGRQFSLLSVGVCESFTSFSWLSRSPVSLNTAADTNNYSLGGCLTLSATLNNFACIPVCRNVVIGRYFICIWSVQRRMFKMSQGNRLTNINYHLSGFEVGVRGVWMFL